MNAKHKSSLLKKDNLKHSCGHSSGLWRFDNQHFWEWCWLGEHKEQPKENHCQQGWTSDGNHDALSLWMDCMDSCDPTPLRNPQVLHEMGETHSCPEAVCLGRLGTMSMYKYLFSKSQQLSLGRGSTIRWPSHLERKPCSEIRLPLPSAGFWQEQHWGYRWWHWWFKVLEEDEWTGWVTSLTWFWLVMCYCMKDFLGQDR